MLYSTVTPAGISDLWALTGQAPTYGTSDWSRRLREDLSRPDLTHADRARLEATELNRRGDLHGTRERVKRVRRRVAEYVGNDPDLVQAVVELRDVERQMSKVKVSSVVAKEIVAESYRHSKGQIDRR